MPKRTKGKLPKHAGEISSLAPKDQSDLFYPEDLLPEEQGLEDADFIPIPIPSPRSMAVKASKGAMKLSKDLIQKLSKDFRSLSGEAREQLLKKGIDEKEFIKRGAKIEMDRLKKVTPGSSGKHPPGSRPYQQAKAKHFEKMRKEGPRPKDFTEPYSNRSYKKPDLSPEKKAPSGKTLRWDSKTGKVEEIED